MELGDVAPLAWIRNVTKRIKAQPLFYCGMWMQKYFKHKLDVYDCFTDNLSSRFHYSNLFLFLTNKPDSMTDSLLVINN